MINKVLKTITKYNLISKNDKVIIAVSGGPDSMCLLDILNNLQNKLKISIFVAHVNHMIRKEADTETEYVEEYCSKNNIPCFVKRVNVIDKANTEKIGTEEAGRKARYEFFEEIANQVGANKIAIAHNANDNAETVLMHIIRGSGASGLKGIEPIRDNKFIRPLIECNRVEIEKYCQDCQLQPMIDKSNFENVYTRNKVRNMLLPIIKEEFNPNIIESLNKMSELLRDENDFIEKYVDDMWKSLLINNSNNEIVLNLKDFNKQDRFIRSKIILKSIKTLNGSTQGIEKIHVDDIIKLCEKNVGNKYLTPNKFLKVYVNRSKVSFITFI